MRENRTQGSARGLSGNGQSYLDGQETVPSPMIFASNFDAFLPLLLGVPVALVGLGLISLFAAFRGHWSAVPLAAPSILVGLVLTWGIVTDSRPDQLIPVLWLLFPAPLAVGSASIILWAKRRRPRGGQP